jgi:hypothetical protein
MNPNSQTTTLPDNLISRFNRIYIDERQFTDDAGKIVKYDRLVLEGTLNDVPFLFEYKLDKKDKVIMTLLDQATGSI